jgi:hypothetical protein
LPSKTLPPDLGLRTDSMPRDARACLRAQAAWCDPMPASAGLWERSDEFRAPAIKKTASSTWTTHTARFIARLRQGEPEVEEVTGESEPGGDESGVLAAAAVLLLIASVALLAEFLRQVFH